MVESQSIDIVIENFQKICDKLSQFTNVERELTTLSQIHSRLSTGALHLAVIGQFNRGKSTFINRLLGVELLPTSVLPLTAIPTEIRYGLENKLTISFESKEETFYEQDEIITALKKYATEDENPKNRHGVTEIVLEADSELLSHGTKLFDTPGFGSTHIHNTKSTVSLLKECDAALFMLSADLPITMMELNFIKQISQFVSKIFFIYNKVDLISDEELNETTHFIESTIKKELHIDTVDRFFPISAKMAKDDEINSGLQRVRDEIIEFIQREKYFSLAEAINSKIIKSKDSILSLIQKEIERRKGAQENSDLDALQNNIEALKQRLIAINSYSHDNYELLKDFYISHSVEVEKIVEKLLSSASIKKKNEIKQIMSEIDDTIVKVLFNDYIRVVNFTLSAILGNDKEGIEVDYPLPKEIFCFEIDTIDLKFSLFSNEADKKRLIYDSIITRYNSLENAIVDRLYASTTSIINGIKSSKVINLTELIKSKESEFNTLLDKSKSQFIDIESEINTLTELKEELSNISI